MRTRLFLATNLLLGLLFLTCGGDDSNDSNTRTAQTDIDASVADAQIGGEADSGVAEDGGGTDAGIPPPRTVNGFTSYTTSNGLPATIKDVSRDQSGNLWVAGYDGLYLLRPGANGFEKFTQANGLQQWKVLSVAGLGNNEVMVGYEGVFGGQEDNDPDWMKKSGGVDRVTLTGNSLNATHYIFFTPPGLICETPADEDVCANGRFKIRSVFTIRPDLTGPFAGNIWFGGNHGVALWDAKNQQMLEHRHASIEAIDKNGNQVFMSGDYWGVAIDSDHNVWIGGAHREARIPYAKNRDFNAPLDPILDTWPDKSAADRTDDHVKALAIDTSGNLWIGSLVNDLARYNTSTHATDFFNKAQGTPDTAVTALAADPDGTVWVGSYVGIGRYNPNTRTWTYYHQKTHGLADDSISSIQIDTRTSPRTVLIGTTNGVSVYQGP